MLFDQCVQINLQQALGGGEIYTAAIARAMCRLGLPSQIVTHAHAGFWRQLDIGQATLCSIKTFRRTTERESLPRTLFIVHAGLNGEEIEQLKAAGCFVLAFAHMPYHERSPQTIAHADLICAVSRYVLTTLRDKGVENVYPEPFFGVGDLSRQQSATGQLLCRESEFEWDRRKLRERVLSKVYPLVRRFRKPLPFRRPAGMTLGLVSRIATIKQFPQLFTCLLPVLLAYPECHVAVFGQGGYKSVRELKRVLQPLGDRVSYWGHQSDVRQVYQSIDWLMSGLPEKEALGLNIIEAQMVGVPVLAVNAPPFSETVCDNVTGLLYTDPRQDGAASFRSCLEKIRAGLFVRDAEQAAIHLERFSEAAFAGRFQRLLDDLRQQEGSCCVS